MASSSQVINVISKKIKYNIHSIGLKRSQLRYGGFLRVIEHKLDPRPFTKIRTHLI